MTPAQLLHAALAPLNSTARRKIVRVWELAVTDADREELTRLQTAARVAEFRKRQRYNVTEPTETTALQCNAGAAGEPPLPPDPQPPADTHTHERASEGDEPGEAEVVAYGRTLTNPRPCPEQKAREWWLMACGRGWRDASGARLLRWRPAFAGWWSKIAHGDNGNRGAPVMPRRAVADHSAVGAFGI